MDKNSEEDICMGDTLYDLRDNSFCVKAVAMYDGKNVAPVADRQCEISLESPDGNKKVSGSILLKKMMKDILPNDIEEFINQIESAEDLIEIYELVHKRFVDAEDKIYDYEEGTDEYKDAFDSADAWGNLMDILDKKIMQSAKEEGLLQPKEANAGTAKQIDPFMNKYGYFNECGWWFKQG